MTPTSPDAEFCDLPALLAERAREQPHAPALIDGQRRLDFGALDVLVDRIAARLQRDGLQPTEAVAVCGTASIEYVALFIGVLRAGGAVAPLAPSSTPGQLAAMVADSGARWLFADDEVRAALAGQAIDAPMRPLDEAGFTAWLGKERLAPGPVAIDPAWPFNLIYSSGTTGTPKGIVQPHAMRWAHIRRAAQAGHGPGAVLLVATPLYSNTTLVALVPALAWGSCAVLMRKFDAGEYLRLAALHRATHTMLVPVQYRRLLAHADFDRTDLSGFRVKLCTSAPFHAELKAEVLRRWPGGLTEYYGLTEGGGTCILQAHLHPGKLHTVGQPAEGHDIRLVDDQGHEVPAGEPGEVVGRSPAMMSGYHGQPALTAAAEWHDAEGRRFIRTGDIGRFDADGFLILFDRKKDMIISGGFNIYPSDLEALLREHPAVADAAVFGVPSEAWGETPVAALVLRNSAPAEAVGEWLNARVGKTQRLFAALALAELPRSAIGKVLKRELRERWLAEQAASSNLPPGRATD